MPGQNLLAITIISRGQLFEAPSPAGSLTDCGRGVLTKDAWSRGADAANQWGCLGGSEFLLSGGVQAGVGDLTG